MSARATRGFSLIELLVVIVIIALGASLAVAWLAGTRPGERLEREARDLAGTFRLAADVARARQRVIGWQPQGDGYRFVSWQPGHGWQAFGERLGLAAQRWDPPLQPSRKPPAADTTTPWLVWLPDGEVVGAHIQLASDGARRTLAVDALGVSVTGRGR
ncbi:GspH/FimT family pseudopilin [Salinicola sp. JS01]|uniref:GspH/FimT family pseudopilin n=1 Tax=Salinicola sp. JS01 TaxID=3050071 RepID=UPI00255B7683|nr:GspH/FimT family pseudopilin [Salinicola sp. JS01]WIX31971.1 GspH/FimT family pseudopilin [Salinicola sp. JS01]